MGKEIKYLEAGTYALQMGCKNLQPIKALFKTIQLEIFIAKVGHLCNTLYQSLLRSGNGDRNSVATRDAVMTRKLRLDPDFSI